MDNLCEENLTLSCASLHYGRMGSVDTHLLPILAELQRVPGCAGVEGEIGELGSTGKGVVGGGLVEL